MPKRAITRTVYFFWLAIIALFACKAGPPQITIDSPKAALSPSLLRVASVFLRISNAGGAVDTLTGARVDLPGTITELHDIQDGKMIKVRSITVPAGETVVLRPARYHIMAFNLPNSLKEGGQLPLVLTFEHSGEIRLTIPLTKFSPAQLHN